MSIKCNNKGCGHTNVDGTSYCVKCGQLLGAMYEKVVVAKSEYESKTRKVNDLEQDKKRLEHEKRQLEDRVITLTNTDKVRVEQINRQRRDLDDISKNGSAPAGYELISKAALEEERKNVLAHVSKLKTELDDIKKNGFAPEGYHLKKDTFIDIHKLKRSLNEKTLPISEYNDLVRRANQSWYGKLWDIIKRWWDESAFGIILFAIISFGAMVFYFTTDGIVKSCSNNSDEVSVKIVQRDGLWGVSKGDEVVIPFEYDSIVTDRFNADYSRIYKGENVGLINVVSGKEIVPCIYRSIGDPNNSSLDGKLIAIQKSDGKWNYVDYSGRPTKQTNLKLDYAEWWSNADMGIVGMRINGEMKYGYVDETGYVKISCKYAVASDFFEGLALVKNAKYGPWICINEDGEEQYKLKYTLGDIYQESLMAVTNDLEWTSKTLFGFVDRKGELVIGTYFTPWIHNDGGFHYPRFSDGKAEVHYMGKNGWIDKTGKFTPAR